MTLQAQETLHQAQVDAKEKVQQHTQLLLAKQELKNKGVLIAKLELENKYLKRLQLGASNEALPLAISDLFAEILDADIAAINQEAEQRQDLSTPSTILADTRKQRAIGRTSP